MSYPKNWLNQIDSDLFDRFERVCIITGRSPQRNLAAIMGRFISKEAVKIVDTLDMGPEQDPLEVATTCLEKIRDMYLGADLDLDVMEAVMALCMDEMTPLQRDTHKSALHAHGLTLVKHKPDRGEHCVYFHNLAVAVNHQALRDATGLKKYSRALRAHPDFFKDTVAVIAGKPTRCVLIRLDSRPGGKNEIHE